MWRRSVQGLTGMDASAEVREKADYTPSSLSVHVPGGYFKRPKMACEPSRRTYNDLSIPRTHDAYVQGLVEHICTKISVKFPGGEL